MKASTDIANVNNDGFSIVNIDTSKMNYSRYCWHAAGYKVIKANDALFDNISNIDDSGNGN